MILNVNDDYVVEDITKASIKKCIGKLKNDKFAVLERDEENFLQVYIGDSPEDSIIEYHEGHAHYQAELSDTETTVKVFHLYLGNNEKFKDHHSWVEAVIDESEYED